MLPLNCNECTVYQFNRKEVRFTMVSQNEKVKDSKSTVRGFESLIEVVLLAIVYYCTWRLGYEEGIFPPYFGKGKYVLMAVYGLITYLLVNNLDGFRFGDLRRFDLALAQWIGVFLTNCLTYLQLCLIANQMVSPAPILLLTAIEAVLVVAFIYLYTAIYRRLYAPYNMAMVVGTDNGAWLKLKMDTRKDKYIIRRLISVEDGLEKICQQIQGYDAVVINDAPAQIRNDILKFCYKNQIRTYIVPKISDILVRGAHDVSIFDTPLALIKGTGLSFVQRCVKRAMDITLCLIALIIASPIMLVIALAIKLEDGGPVFYTQKRATIGGREFDILKFRSMIVNAEKEGNSIPATDHDPRITKVGRIIRATRIDELPQILNILKGDMSIVGPRPERLEHVQKYSEEIPEFGYRLKVKGGLTGYAQIYGKYNTTAYDKLRLDLMYIENYSLLLDIKLILMTVRIMFQKESTEGFKEAEQVSVAGIQAELEKAESSEESKDVVGV